MASEKISAMTAATAIANTDVVAGLESGANVKITRPIFLQALTGEAIFIANDVATMSISATGDIDIASAAGEDLFVRQNSGGSFLQIDSGNNINIRTVAAGTSVSVFWNAGAAGLQINGSGAVFLFADTGQIVTIFFTPGTPGDWAGSPANYQVAIDRIAAAVAGILGSAIP